MRVAMVTASYPPDRCAIGHFSSLLSREMARLGHQVFIVGPKGPGGRDPADAGCGAGSGDVGPVHLVVRGQGDWGIRGCRRVWEQTCALRPEVVNFQFVPNLYGRYGMSVGPIWLAYLARASGTPLVVTCHELSMPWSSLPHQFGIAAIQRVQLAALVCQAEAVIVTTEHRLRKLRHWLPFKRGMISAVPVGANILPQETIEARSPDANFASQGILQLTFFGSMHPSKQPDVALLSLVSLLESGLNARLVFVGSERGEVAPWLARLTPRQRSVAGDAVTCTGWVSTEEASRLLAATDIFLLPLVDGVSGLRGTFAAALAHRLPIVATRGRETSQELAASGAVELVEGSRPEEFLTRVRELAHDSQRRKALSAKAEGLYEKDFTWMKIAERTVEVYAAASSGRRGDTAQRAGTVGTPDLEGQDA